MTNRRAAVGTLLLVVAMSACRVERTPRALDSVTVTRTEIELTMLGYQNAVLNNDARRVAAYFTPGAQLHLAGTTDIRGRAAIDAMMSSSFREAQVVAVVMETDALDVGARVAHQFGTYRQRVRDGGGVERNESGRFVIRWQRAEGSAWQIERMMVNGYPTP